MQHWTKLGAAAAPGGGELRLMQRGSEFSIMVGSDELMNSRRGGSEEALAVLACRRLADTSAAKVLIGGLGMGFTLRSALAELGPGAQITVAELVPEVVSWARGPLATVFRGCLDDPRAQVLESDVWDLVLEGSAYDAILLDVDNGPAGIVQPGNDRLYDEQGLSALRGALRPGGVLAIWSAAASPAFVRRLERAGFVVEASTAVSGSARHVIWIARPRQDPPVRRQESPLLQPRSGRRGRRA